MCLSRWKQLNNIKKLISTIGNMKAGRVDKTVLVYVWVVQVDCIQSVTFEQGPRKTCNIEEGLQSRGNCECKAKR